MYVVTVLFNIQAAHYSEFMEAMTSNAQTSLKTEPGCHLFDVCESSAVDGHQVFLYEVYGSQEDFQAHLAAPHFMQFNTLTASWVIDKTVAVFNRISPSP